jgi:hypothetical protein
MYTAAIPKFCMARGRQRRCNVGTLWRKNIETTGIFSRQNVERPMRVGGASVGGRRASSGRHAGTYCIETPLPQDKAVGVILSRTAACREAAIAWPVAAAKPNDAAQPLGRDRHGSHSLGIPGFCFLSHPPRFARNPCLAGSGRDPVTARDPSLGPLFGPKPPRELSGIGPRARYRAKRAQSCRFPAFRAKAMLSAS